MWSIKGRSRLKTWHTGESRLASAAELVDAVHTAGIIEARVADTFIVVELTHRTYTDAVTSSRPVHIGNENVLAAGTGPAFPGEGLVTRMRPLEVDYH